MPLPLVTLESIFDAFYKGSFLSDSILTAPVIKKSSRLDYIRSITPRKIIEINPLLWKDESRSRRNSFFKGMRYEPDYRAQIYSLLKTDESIVNEFYTSSRFFLTNPCNRINKAVFDEYVNYVKMHSLPSCPKLRNLLLNKETFFVLSWLFILAYLDRNTEDLLYSYEEPHVISEQSDDLNTEYHIKFYEYLTDLPYMIKLLIGEIIYELYDDNYGKDRNITDESITRAIKRNIYRELVRHTDRSKPYYEDKRMYQSDYSDIPLAVTKVKQSDLKVIINHMVKSGYLECLGTDYYLTEKGNAFYERNKGKDCPDSF